MATLLQTPRSAHFSTGMSSEIDHSYPDFARPAPTPSHLSALAIHTSQQLPSQSSASANSDSEAMFNFVPPHSAPIETASCPPDGPSFPIDFEADPPSTAPPMGSVNGQGSLGHLSTDSSLSFPELPASLLDDAPEYEFSAHTRLNVFDSLNQFGVVSFGMDPTDTPVLSAASEYGLWSTSSSLPGDGQLTANSEYTMPNTASYDAMDLPPPPSADPSQYTPDGVHVARFGDSFDHSSDTHATRGPPPPSSYMGPISAQSDRSMLSSSDGLPPGVGDPASAPSVLYPGPTSVGASVADEMYESRAGPSRTSFKSSRENSPFPYSRPTPYQRPQVMPGANPSVISAYPPSDLDPAQRRHSGDKVGGKDIMMVPSQAPGKGRLVGGYGGANSNDPEQAGRMAAPPPMSVNSGLPGRPDAPGYGPPPPNGMPHRSPGSGGMGELPPTVHPHMMGGGEMGMMPGGGPPMHPVGRGVPHHLMQPQPPHMPRGAMFAGGPPGPMHHHHHPHHNGHFMGGSNSSDMINALGDAMDASIDAEGIARCPYPNCNKTFAKNRSYNLKAHLRSHSQLKPFACSVCPRAFSRKHDLERHARVHSGDKPYVCEICGKGFPRSDALRRHWRVEKECGEKAALLEAGQPLAAVMNAPASQQQYPQGWDDMQRRR